MLPLAFALLLAPVAAIQQSFVCALVSPQCTLLSALFRCPPSPEPVLVAGQPAVGVVLDLIDASLPRDCAAFQCVVTKWTIDEVAYEFIAGAATRVHRGRVYGVSPDDATMGLAHTHDVYYASDEVEAFKRMRAEFPPGKATTCCAPGTTPIKD